MTTLYTDSRGVITDFECMDSDREAYADMLEELVEDASDEAREMLMRHTDWSPEREELWEDLKNACIEGSSYKDWDCGTELIPEDDFNGEFAERLCEDSGYLPQGGLPSFIIVDWKATAENLKADYCTITICGQDYYIRG